MVKLPCILTGKKMEVPVRKLLARREGCQRALERWHREGPLRYRAHVVEGIARAIDAFEADENIGCIVLTGSKKAFAAGADIGFMKDFGYMDAYKPDFITRSPTPAPTKPARAARPEQCPAIRSGHTPRKRCRASAAGRR